MNWNVIKFYRFRMPFFIGQKVEFKRTNGTWSIGVVKDILGDYVLVQWLTDDRLQVATKKVHQIFVKSIKNSNTTTRNSLYIVLLVILLLLLDSFLYLKKVWKYLNIRRAIIIIININYFYRISTWLLNCIQNQIVVMHFRICFSLELKDALSSRKGKLWTLTFFL